MADTADTDGYLSIVGNDTISYLDQRATESFKRQLDLEESIWRSLPFFTAALIAASAMLAHAASSLPPLAFETYALVGNLLLVLSALAFLVSFLWLWGVPWPRDSEYPARDDELAAYAAEMTAFHAQNGLEGEALDAATLRELRIYMTKIFGEAAQSHFTNNQARLSARSQALLFLLLGFVLAFACDATTFVPKIASQVFQPRGSDAHAATQNTIAAARDAAKPRGIRSTNPAASADNNRWGVDNENERGSANSKQVDDRRKQTAAWRCAAIRDIGAKHGAPHTAGKADDNQDRAQRGANGSIATAAPEQEVALSTRSDHRPEDRNDRQQDAAACSQTSVDTPNATHPSKTHEGQ